MPQALVKLTDLAARLAPLLGEEKSQEVVVGAARALDILSPTLSVRDALRLLDALGKSAGMVGAAARFAVNRYAAELQLGAAATQVVADAADAAAAVERTKARPEARADRLLTARQLVSALESSLGNDKAQEAVLAS